MMDKNKDGSVVKTKAVALKNHFSNVEEVRGIDINPPTLFGDVQTGVRRLRKDKVMVDHESQKQTTAKKCVYSAGLGCIFTLSNRSESIGAFDRTLRKIRTLTILDPDLKESAQILDFAWSEKHLRVVVS